MDYDKIIVMDQGVITEYGTPFELLACNSADTKITNTEGVLAKMALETGDESAQTLLNIARESWLKKQGIVEDDISLDMEK